MPKPIVTVEEARLWFAANQERLRRRFANMEDSPAELTPDGQLNLSRRSTSLNFDISYESSQNSLPSLLRP
ncbi:MAG: hypothetical protein RL701_4297 [Pseudomonadota bacterium]